MNSDPDSANIPSMCKPRHSVPLSCVSVLVREERNKGILEKNHGGRSCCSRNRTFLWGFIRQLNCVGPLEDRDGPWSHCSTGLQDKGYASLSTQDTMSARTQGPRNRDRKKEQVRSRYTQNSNWRVTDIRSNRQETNAFYKNNIMLVNFFCQLDISLGHLKRGNLFF